MENKEEDALLRIVYVQDPAELEETCRLFSEETEIAVDLEFDDMNFAYGRHLSLVQVWAGQTAYLLDAILLQDLTPLIKVLEDPRVVKIFHSCRNDLLLLSELYNVQIRNVQDTSTMFRLLGEYDGEISLKDLLQLKLNISVEKGEQTSNWLVRPLTESQCLYAANDVAFLIPMKNLLLAQLRDIDRLNWMQEECQAFEQIRFQEDPEPYLRVAKKFKLEPHFEPLLKALWYFRDRLARQLNKPSYWVLSNETLAKLVQHPPRTAEAWKEVRGVHANVRTPAHVQELISIVAEHAVLPPSPRDAALAAQESRRKRNPANRQRYKVREARKDLLTALKPVVAEKHGQSIANFFMTNRRLEEIMEQGTEKILSQWQKEILQECCLDKSLDYSILQ